jgi:PST family polysaccharide transporter
VNPTTVSARAARGAAWLGASYATAQALSFVSTIVLARLLRPADFGIVAMANLMLAFVGPLHDSGLAAAFVARRERVRESAATLAWTTPITGALAWAAVVAAAPLVARLFGDPAVTPVVRALGATFLLRGLAAAPMAVITKELAFGARSLAVTAGAFVEGATGIGLALAGLGLWSLVAGQIAGAGVTATVAWLSVPWRPWGRFSRARLRWDVSAVTWSPATCSASSGRTSTTSSSGACSARRPSVSTARRSAGVACRRWPSGRW